MAPGAESDAIVGRHGEGWKVRVAAAPERGAANRAVVRLLADALRLPAASVSVVSGRAGRDKIIELTGIAPAETDGRLRAAERKDTR